MCPTLILALGYQEAPSAAPGSLYSYRTLSAATQPGHAQQSCLVRSSPVVPVLLAVYATLASVILQEGG